MGAWIETAQLSETYAADRVAPCMGAWIETPRGSPRGSPRGRTLYGCVD